MKLLTQSTPLALWYEIIQEAESKSGISLKQDLESYLIFLLIRYIKRPDLLHQILATEFLTGLKHSQSKRIIVLQEVGDQCLLFSGLFPGIAERRLVKLSYYVNLGQSAYAGVSRIRNDLFSSLSHQFVRVMNVLQATRENDILKPD